MTYSIKTGETEIVTTSTTQHSYFEVVKGIYAYKTVKRTTSSHPSIEDHELVLQALREARQVSGGGSPDPE